ncbi:MAG: hypothetical protein ACRDRR_09550 [Pseudonocardiaceae bacterium]
MPTWVAALIAVAAITAVYFFCIRPMRNGSCAMSGAHEHDAELDRQIAELREEVRVLRAQDALESGRVPTDRPAPPADA